MATYIKGKTLRWDDIWVHLGMTKDHGGRWYPGPNTHEKIAEYCRQYRAPSRAWPSSYARALQTAKFAKWLAKEIPDLAIKLKVAE